MHHRIGLRRRAWMGSENTGGIRWNPGEAWRERHPHGCKVAEPGLLSAVAAAELTVSPAAASVIRLPATSAVFASTHTASVLRGSTTPRSCLDLGGQNPVWGSSLCSLD
jgi:hypothetical protein